MSSISSFDIISAVLRETESKECLPDPTILCIFYVFLHMLLMLL